MLPIRTLLQTALLVGAGILPSSAVADPNPSSSTTTTTTTKTTTARQSTSQTTKIILRLPNAHPYLPNPHLLPASTLATLSAPGLSFAAPLSADNAFVFPAVNASASYLAEVHCQTHAFVPLRLDVEVVAAAAAGKKAGGAGEGGEAAGGGKAAPTVRVRAWETIRGNDWGNKGEGVPAVREGEGAWALEARVLGGKWYFMERSTFSVLSVFKNPIILLSLISMALFFGMPKLVENMDPELRAEWEERQKENPMNAIMGAASGQGANPMGSFDMAAFLAGSKPRTEESSGNGNGNGKAKGEVKKKR
ncbi:hypothetical protein VTJ83DRAFT_6739 [Remersonia thermophila]|uniref:ER membrane protein complex subunit 7 beta-sandwich domain-containing protein n=1 Tax=Remersonia thermophila TaxID=72144 RepID=A0ABR4D6H2_9PEZI